MGVTRGERLGKNVMDSTDSPLQRWRYVDATLAESVESTTFLQALYAGMERRHVEFMSAEAAAEAAAKAEAIWRCMQRQMAPLRHQGSQELFPLSAQPYCMSRNLDPDQKRQK